MKSAPETALAGNVTSVELTWMLSRHLWGFGLRTCGQEVERWGRIRGHLD